jgi:hypothetical protein
MMTEQEYRTTRARIDAYETWRNGRSPIDPKDVPPGMTVTNEERSAVEVYEFVRDRPASYFAYVALPNAARPWCKRPTLITWTGDELGRITLGNTWRGNMGDVRQAIRVQAINGVTYSGTYYRSAGDYARLKAVKS